MDRCMLCSIYFLYFKQKTAYEMRISDWSSDVCSSNLVLDTAVVRQVDRLRDRAGDKRLCCGHHADMRFRRQEPFSLAAAVCAVEYSVMLLLQARRSLDRAMQIGRAHV